MSESESPKRYKKIPLLGRSEDVGEPGLDKLVEVRGIVRSIMEDREENKISSDTAKRILGAVKAQIKKSTIMDTRVKAAALAIVNDAMDQIKASEPKKSKKKKRSKRKRKKKKKKERSFLNHGQVQEEAQTLQFVA